jgi:short-subunit dehydrogenase
VEIEGKRVLLTGATGGLGRAIAQEVAARGGALVLSSRREAELNELKASLPGGDRKHTALVADLAEPGAAEKLVTAAGEVDVLIANAGLPASGKLDDFTSNEIERAVRVNLESSIQMTRVLIPQLARSGAGHIVIIASLAGKVSSPRASLYNATKFGVRGFCFGLREELRPHGVGVSAVSPGFVRDAGMFADAGSKPPRGAGTVTPGRVAKEVVRAIRDNQAEITVAPRRQRISAEIGYRHPGFSAWIQRHGGADRIAERVAAGQASKR